MHPSDIEFYFDPISPYAWLASTQLHRISAASNRTIVAKPVLFAGLLKAHGHKGPAEIPAKRAYIFRDVMRRAKMMSLELEGPPSHPFNPLLALRVCTAIEDNQQRLQFAKTIMHKAWSEGMDITDTSLVAKFAEECGLNGDWALSAAADDSIKQALVKQTQHAIELGLFGVPSFTVKGQLYWGDDRIDDVIHFLGQPGIDEEKLDTILSRESAHRKV